MATRERNTRRIPWVRFLAITSALFCASAVGVMARQALTLGPRIGDIIAFEAIPSASGGSDARLIATRPGGGECALDLDMLRRSGGSLILEQRLPSPSRQFRVHWAGPRTSEDGLDCGRDAELMLSVAEVGRLASAAGGFGPLGARSRSSR